jgi:hypothetical protein
LNLSLKIDCVESQKHDFMLTNESSLREGCMGTLRVIKGR